MPLHPRPTNPEPSPLLRRFAAEITDHANGPIVDVGCGYGRNAMCIAGYGVPVVCLDKDPAALVFIESARRHSSGRSMETLLTTCQIDLEHDPWPFGHEALGAIISVQCPPQQLLYSFSASLKVGGYLFLETIGGQGGNYLELPDAGFAKTALGDAFEFRYFKETRVGPASSRAATTRLLAVKVSQR